MSNERSVTGWLGELKAGNRAAARPLWDRYFRTLVVRARAALGTSPRASADEEDVALSAFGSFCRGVEQGRFPRLNDRDHLWHVLLTITARKAAHQIRDGLRLKRGGGGVKAATDLARDDQDLLAEVIGAEPTPELAAEVAEEYRRLLGVLADDEQRAIATRHMEGYTVAEIAARTGKSERTVARKLAIIRERWEAEEA